MHDPDEAISSGAESSTGSYNVTLPVRDYGEEADHGPERDVKETESYNPKKHQDDVRARITYCLFALIAAVVALFMACFVWTSFKCEDPTKHLAALKDLAPVVLTPLVAIFGTAVGFYFGSQSEKTTPPAGE